MTVDSKMITRKFLKANRQDLTPTESAKSSHQIISSSIDLIPWLTINSLHCYVPIITDNEVDSWPLLEYVWKNYAEIQTVVPRLNANGKYDSVVVTEQTKLNYQGVRIPEPVGGVVLNSSTKFDVIIVPMLGFDEKGHRIGHGLGWYDRFLINQKQAITIGLSHEIGLVTEGIDYEPHDVALKYIVTEKFVRKI